MYVLTITDEFGCTQQILVSVDVLIERIVNVFPNVFSPNGDNNNDLFIFRPIQGTVMAISLDIYDRWGNLMHSDQVTSEEITWEGTTNGQELVPGVYIYKATILYSDNRSETVVSDLLILR